ncbi:killer cell immunoglobulin-like receptor 3DL1, partial [Sigmodon hispidus]
MLAQAGRHDKPSLIARPSHIVQLGQHFELQCNYHNKPYLFKMYKENGDPLPHLHGRIFQKGLLLGPVTSAYGGTYRCYMYNQYPKELLPPSDPLQIIISGIYRKPFLLVLPTPLVNIEEKVTMQCHSEIMFDTFILISHKNDIFKESFQLPAESHTGGFHANFSIGPVTPYHAETYICYGSLQQTSHEWSESSAPINIWIIGLYKKPSLSALMNAVVKPGENMTLFCISDIQFDMFHLFRDDVPQGHMLPTVRSQSGTCQANFLLVPVIQAGNYRCYGSFRNSSHVWSSPSDPLYLHDT